MHTFLNMHEILVNIDVVGCERVLLLDIQIICELVGAGIGNCIVDIIENIFQSNGPMTAPWKIILLSDIFDDELPLMITDAWRAAKYDSRNAMNSTLSPALRILCKRPVCTFCQKPH